MVIFATEQNRQVEDALRSFLARTGRGDLARLEVLQVVERPFSAIAFFRAHTDQKPYEAVLKKVVHHPMNLSLTKRENQAEVEYAMLSSLFPHFAKEEHCGVPEPIAVFPAEEAYLMEYVSGTLLNEKFRAARYLSSRKDFAKLCNWYSLCGRWLKIFQEVTRIEPASADIFSATLARCEEKLDMIGEARDPRCPADLKAVVMAQLHGELRKLASARVLAAGRHGDFGGWNILAHDNGITVFDFLGSQEDPVAVDVLKMLVNLADEKHYLFYSNQKVEALTRSFLAGYGSLPKIERPVAVICETLHRVCSLCASVAHTDGIGLRRKFEKHLSFKEHLAWLYGQDKQLLWTNVEP